MLSLKREKLDFSSCCLYCNQPPGKKEISRPKTFSTLETIICYIKDRHHHGDTTMSEVWERICNVDVKIIFEDNCWYHRDCYANIGHKGKRDRVVKRYQESLKQNDASVSKRSAGRPPKRKKRRKLNKELVGLSPLYMIANFALFVKMKHLK